MCEAGPAGERSAAPSYDVEVPSLKLPRIYPILDTGTLARRGLAAVTAAEAMLDGGARILQYRHKGHFSRSVFEEAKQVRALCAEAGALFVVDDRADIAMLLDAGLHVGQDDLAPGDARRLIGSGRVLGFSTHNLEQLCAAAAEPLDYLAFGPVFATRTKENPDPVVGLEGLGRARRAAAGMPLVAIGGITRDTAAAVLGAGADSLAVIHDILPEICTFQSVRARMEEWRRAAERE
jgi:thiamine-phosphate pyrophosphorylase